MKMMDTMTEKALKALQNGFHFSDFSGMLEMLSPEAVYIRENRAENKEVSSFWRSKTGKVSICKPATYSYWKSKKGKESVCEALKQLNDQMNPRTVQYRYGRIRGGKGSGQGEEDRLTRGQPVLAIWKIDDGYDWEKTLYFLTVVIDSAGKIQEIHQKYADGYIWNNEDRIPKTESDVKENFLRVLSAWFRQEEDYVSRMMAEMASSISLTEVSGDHTQEAREPEAVMGRLTDWREEMEPLLSEKYIHDEEEVQVVAQDGRRARLTVFVDTDLYVRNIRIEETLTDANQLEKQKAIAFTIEPDCGAWNTATITIGGDVLDFNISGVEPDMALGCMLSSLYLYLPPSVGKLSIGEGSEAGEQYVGYIEDGKTFIRKEDLLTSKSMFKRLREQRACFGWDQESTGYVWWSFCGCDGKEDFPLIVCIRYELEDEYTYFVGYRSFCYAFCKGFTEAIKKWGIRGYVECTDHHDCNMEQFIALKAYAMHRESDVKTESFYRVPGNKRTDSRRSNFKKEMEIFLADLK